MEERDIGRINMASAITRTKEKISPESNGIFSPALCPALSPAPGEARGELRDRSKVKYPRRTVWVTFCYPPPKSTDLEDANLKGANLEGANLEGADLERSTSHITEIIPTRWETDFTPRTVMGKMLLILRNKAITAGMRLLSKDEVLEEVKRRRGEIEEGEIKENETDLP